MADPEQTGEQVGSIVQTAVADANAQTQAELDAAKQRADDAQAAARQISDAAIQSELGQRLNAQREEFQSWKTAQETELQMLRAQSQEATGLLGSIRQLLTTPTPAPVSNPPPSAAVPVTAPTAASSTKTEPSEKPKVAAETQPPPERKPRHFL